MRKRRRWNKLAVLLAAMLAFSSAGTTAFADPAGAAVIEELEEESSEIIEEDAEEAAEEIEEAAGEEAEIIAEEAAEEAEEAAEAEEEPAGTAEEAASEELPETLGEEPAAAAEEAPIIVAEEEPAAAAEEEPAAAVEEEPAAAVEEEPAAAAADEPAIAAEEEPVEAAEEEPAAAAEEEPAAAAEEEPAAEIEKETAEAAPEKTAESAPETKEQAETVKEETIAAEKLEANPPNFKSYTMPITYVGETDTIAYSSYVNDSANNPGQWNFEVVDTPYDVNVYIPTDGVIQVTPTDNFVEVSTSYRRMTIRLTSKTDPSATGTHQIMMRPTYYRADDRLGSNQSFYSESPFYELITGDSLPDISSITGDTDWYSADARWQYSNDGSTWVNCSATEKVQASRGYRVYLTLKHDLAPKSGYSWQDCTENDKYDFDYNYTYYLNHGATDDVIESFDLINVQDSVNRGAPGSGISTMEAYTETFTSSTKPTGITLPSTKTMTAGEQGYLNAAVTPSDCTMPVTYTSSDTSVAEINETTGWLTAKKVGTATITAAVGSGAYAKTAVCKVTVKDPAIEFTLAANTSSGIILAWNKVPGATYYMLERLNDDETGTIVINSNVQDTKYTVPLDGLKSGKRYEFIVMARKGFSSLCGDRLKHYYIGVTKMNAPTCTAKGFRVTWPKVDGAEKYAVFRHIGSGPMNWKYLTTVPAKDAATQEYRTASTQGLIPGEWYAYTVRAIGPENTYGGQPAGRSVRYREPVKITKVQNITSGARATFTSVAAGYTYGLYRAPVTNGTVGTYTRVATVTSTTVGKDVWITDKTAVSGKGYSYYVRCLSKDLAVPLSSYANEMKITYKKP